MSCVLCGDRDSFYVKVVDWKDKEHLTCTNCLATLLMRKLMGKLEE